MELEGVVHNGVIVPDEPTAFPEGTRVRIEAVPGAASNGISIFDLFGKAAMLRSGEDIATQIREERDAWGGTVIYADAGALNNSGQSSDCLWQRPPMGVGKFVLYRFNGDEEFEVERATILAVHDEVGFRLWFEAETDGTCIKSLPDTESLHGRPKAEVAVGLRRVEPARLAGNRFSMPAAYDEEIDDYVASIYYDEHEGLDDNEIE